MHKCANEKVTDCCETLPVDGRMVIHSELTWIVVRQYLLAGKYWLSAQPRLFSIVIYYQFSKGAWHVATAAFFVCGLFMGPKRFQVMKSSW
ncbi:hypothetical protein [Desulfosediminicola flagellatus]|uniref:hypothetical protein n=1 Tax=Desulfosediminicola flagellatus TaxID=2569541 RepID=UPI0010ADA102|nr:hypothetical protein [Desulfosediminicola flagellatus]